MSGDHISCYNCGTGYYSGVNTNCPNCGANPNIFFIIGIVIVLALIAGLAFGAIALTYFARKKSWHWVSYIGSLLVAGFSIYYVAENWNDTEWYTVAIIFLNLFGILYAFYNLFRKWFKWIAIGSILLGIIIAYWPEKDDISAEYPEVYPEEELIEIKEADESDDYTLETKIQDKKEVDTENATEDVEGIEENSYYKIEDPDGWTNLRDSANGNVIRKVYLNERFIIINDENDWCEVFFKDFTSGFIHKSRIKAIKE